MFYGIAYINYILVLCVSAAILAKLRKKSAAYILDYRKLFSETKKSFQITLGTKIAINYKPYETQNDYNPW